MFFDDKYVPEWAWDLGKVGEVCRKQKEVRQYKNAFGILKPVNDLDLCKIFDHERSMWGDRGDSAFKMTPSELLEESFNQNRYNRLPKNQSSYDFSRHMGNYE